MAKDEQNNLGRIMNEKNMTDSDLAERANVSSQTIYRIRNSYNSPVVETAREIAEALDVTLDDIFPVRNIKPTKP